MGIQTRSERERFSRLRQSLLHLTEEIRRIIEPFFSDRPMMKGTVYELKRRCGKPRCRCARGELHRRMVVSASEGGKTRLRVVPKGFLGEVQARVRRYQEHRRARARVGEVYRKMLRVIDEMEAMRREELEALDHERSSKRG